MDRFIVAAFVATFIAAVAAVVGVPVLAQTNAGPIAPTTASPSPEGAFSDDPGRVMRERFVALDTDHDGKISRAEWLAGGRKERGFDFMDADHDGFLTVDELRAGIAKARALRTASRP